MKALDAEKAGMEAENQWRLEIGENIAYDDEAFCQLAEKYRKGMIQFWYLVDGKCMKWNLIAAITSGLIRVGAG